MQQTGYATQDLIRYLWRHRPGNEIPAAVMDTWEELYPVSRRPIILRQARTARGSWWFMVHLPPGLTYGQFRECAEAIGDAVHGAAVIDRRGKRITLEVAAGTLLSRYDYAFDPHDHPRMALPVPLGQSMLGPVVRDLADAPHMLVAGNTGSGKSHLLHVIAVSVLLGRAQLCVIDFKRLEFSYLRRHARLATSPEAARALLDRLNAMLDIRLDTLEGAGALKIQTYRGDMPYIVLLIDELAEMSDKASQQSLNRLLRLSRAAGICVVAATQRPSSATFRGFSDCKALFAARACFRVADAINSRMVIDSGRAAHLPAIPGRAILDWQGLWEVQVPYLSPEDPATVEMLANVEEVPPDGPAPNRLSPR